LIDRHRFPDKVARSGIEGNESAIKGSNEVLSAIQRYTAVDHVTADKTGMSTGHLWIKRPQRFAAMGIDRMYHTSG